MEKELLQNIKSFWNSAELIYKTKDYTSATILYFKCLFGILDYIIFKKIKKTPKDHTERFKILKEEFYELYKIVDKTFQIYRNSYSFRIEKEDCDMVRENVSKLIKEQNI